MQTGYKHLEKHRHLVRGFIAGLLSEFLFFFRVFSIVMGGGSGHPIKKTG
jgi:hypothetical protein